MQYLPYGCARLDKNPRCPDDCSDLPITVFWKEILKLVEHRGSSGRAAETSGQMQVGAVRSFSTTEEGPDKNLRRPDG
jgi:hypothetical protein